MQRLEYIRANPEQLPLLKRYYRENIAQFIDDWGMTYDPRNADIGLPPVVPFVLFPKQREWIEKVIWCWKNRVPLTTEKSRDAGVSWLAVSTASSLCLFHNDLAIGFGSRKAEYVDRLGFPKSLFFKGRMFLRMLPPEFLDGWDEKRHSPLMRISFPGTGSVISGEAGDGIGRGDRSSLYFVDESAWLERPELADAGLSATTNCRIDISSVNGMDNPFAVKRWSGKYEVFTFHWRDDPRKDDAWYARQCELLAANIVAQEIDIDYHASTEGKLIEAAWVEAAIGAAAKLGIPLRGRRRAALDIADEGKDLNSWAMAEGIQLEHLQSWSGKGGDIYKTAVRAFDLCDEHGIEDQSYDADGLGAGFRGDARVINDRRGRGREINATAFRGSGAVQDPEKPIPTAAPAGKTFRRSESRTNEDYFANAKAQAWWNLRVKFQRTARAVEAGSIEGYDPDDLISINPDLPELNKLRMELGQVTYELTDVGRVKVVKTPDGMSSPNRADAVMILNAPRKTHWSRA